MFKVGDRVVCIDTRYLYCENDSYLLNYLGVYTVSGSGSGISGDSIRIDDRKYVYSSERFISLKDQRRNKLNKINNYEHEYNM